MSDIVCVDSHQHFWELQRNDYGWLTTDLKPLYRNFLPADLIPHLEATNTSKTVLVQAAPTLAETLYLLELAEDYEFIAGVVGWVDMEKPEVVSDILKMKQNPLFLGIRPMIQEIPDPDWMLRPELQAIYDKLASLDLTFDALVKPGHLPNLYTLLRRHPQLRVVVDHGAKPNIANNKFQPWADDIETIASNTNAYCKLSGLLTEAGDKPTYEKIQPYMQHLLKCFGSERLMWGSDWPVLELAADYITWHNYTNEFLNDLTLSDQQKILGLNASKFYKI